MKKFIYVKMMVLLPLLSVSQDLINPYQDFTNTWVEQDLFQMLNCKYQYPPQSNYNAPNLSQFLYSPAARDKVSSSSYTGEYQIILDQFPWMFQYVEIIGINNIVTSSPPAAASVRACGA